MGPASDKLDLQTMIEPTIGGVSRSMALASILFLAAGCATQPAGNGSDNDKTAGTIPISELIEKLKAQFRQEELKSAEDAKNGMSPFFTFTGPVTVEFDTVITKSGELGVPTIPLVSIPLNAKLDLSGQYTQKITLQLQPVLLEGFNITTLTRPPPSPTQPAPPDKPKTDSSAAPEPPTQLRNAQLILIGQTLYLVGQDVTSGAEVWVKADPFSSIKAEPKNSATGP